MRLDIFKPLSTFLPEVKPPARAPTLKEKIVWTFIILIIFFTMYNIVPFGAELRGAKFLEFIQVVLASKTGTLLTIGIGPIILASIFLQLFAGAKIIEVDFTNPEDKALFSTAQKSLAIALAFIQAALFILPGFTSPTGGYLGPSQQLIAAGIPVSAVFLMILLQVAGTAILLIFLDEVSSNYGIGSGISLFIAAGVSLAIIQGSTMLIFGSPEVDPAITVISKLEQPSATVIPSIIIALLPIVFSLVIILICLYAEGFRVEIPLAFDRVRGFGSRFPIKLLYVSVLPVILASALLVNIQLLGRTFLYNASFKIGETDIVPFIGYVDPGGNLADGALYYITSFPNPLFAGGYEGYLALLAGSTPYFGIPQFIHIIIYAIVYVGLCVVFGKFWIEAAGMGPSDIAAQITKTGLSVPGFRRDPRIIEAMLKKYIDAITFLGSAFVGLLAVFADLTGAIGGGTGILLTVGIVYKFYEDLKTQNLFELYPQIGKIFGGA